MLPSPNNYTEANDVPREICSMVATTLRHSLYRMAQLVNLAESIAAVVCVSYFCYKYRKKLSFHWNIKILLCALYTSCLIHAIVYSISKVYQLYVSLFVVDECQMFLPRIFYSVTHSLIVFSNCCMHNMQIALTIERFVATVLVDTYETYSRSLGTVLVTILVLVTTVEVVADYTTVSASVLMTNALIRPNTGTNSVIISFGVIFLICLVSLLITISLYCFNSHRRKRSTLTSRYQIAENVIVSALLCVISIIQLLTFAIYAFSMMYLMLTIKADPLLDAYKEVAYLVPLNTLLIPLGSIICIETSKRKRQNGLANLVNLKTQGPQGWQYCSKLLDSQWR